MKRILCRAVFGGALLCLSPAALLAADHDHHAAAPAANAISEGTAKKIDRAGGRITLAHGPLVNLGMGAMTMTFKAAEPRQLDGLKEGDKVRFVAEDRDGVLYAARIEAVK